MKCPKCECEIEISRSDAARALGRVVTEKRIAACRVNAKKPRPTARVAQKRALYEKIFALSDEDRDVLFRAVAAEKPPLPKRKVGRPTNAERERRFKERGEQRY